MKSPLRALGLAVVILLLAPLSSEAQQTRKVYTIGYLGGSTVTPAFRQAFEQGLRDLGWTQGHNIAIEYRSAEGQLDRLPGLAAELVGLAVDVILAASAPETNAAKQATQTIPIVFAVHGDPVGSGHVRSLAHTGGNVTGFSQVHPDLLPKQLDLLRQSVPRMTRVAVVWNARNPTKAHDWREAQAAAKEIGLALEAHQLQSPADLGSVLTAISQRHADAMLILGDPLTFRLRSSLTEFAARERLPAMYPFRQFVEAGGLMSYGANLPDLFRRAAGHVDRILKGAKPGDLPVEQPTKFEFVISGKAARALGLPLSPSLRLRADEIIE